MGNGKIQIFIKVLFIIVSIIHSIGCAPSDKNNSFKRSVFNSEPDGNKNILIGMVEINLENMNDKNKLILNGIHKESITITIQNLETMKEIESGTCASKGYFYFTHLEPGVYRITNVGIYKQGKNHTSSGIGGRFHNGYFTIGKETINNIGKVSVDMNAATNVMSIKQHVIFADIKSEFANDFPKSGWNNQEWKDIVCFW